jgi:hypothetical protein
MVIESGRIRWMGHIAYTGKQFIQNSECKILWGKYHLAHLGVNVRIILK